MTTETKLKRKDLGNLLKLSFPEYKGRKITMKVQEEYRTHSSNLFWSGGSKTAFVVFDQQLNTVDTRATNTSNPITMNHDYVQIDLGTEYIVIELVKMGMSKWIIVFVGPNSDWLPKLIKETK